MACMSTKPLEEGLLRKFIICLALAAVCALGAGGVAGAAPGPNGHNDYGLCKAYFSGSQKGQDNKQSKKPFVALRTKAGDQDGDGDTDNDDVAAYCENTTPGGKSSAAKRTSSTSVSATRLGL
jgi:hypothetical protein